MLEYLYNIFHILTIICLKYAAMPKFCAFLLQIWKFTSLLKVAGILTNDNKTDHDNNTKAYTNTQTCTKCGNR